MFNKGGDYDPGRIRGDDKRISFWWLHSFLYYVIEPEGGGNKSMTCLIFKTVCQPVCEILKAALGGRVGQGGRRR